MFKVCQVTIPTALYAVLIKIFKTLHAFQYHASNVSDKSVIGMFCNLESNSK